MNAEIDLLVELHKRFADPDTPLTKEDIAYFAGRLEQALKSQGILMTPEVEPKKRSLIDIFKGE